MTTLEERAFDNGKVGHYEPCLHCDGTGSVTASWGELYHCHACGCSGRRLVAVTEEVAA